MNNSNGTEDPNEATINSAKILFGMEINASSVRLMSASTQPPEAAATSPSTTPAVQASTVAANATPME
ncbi:hypothetical protein D9M71_834860 [compost metagenome]